MYLFNWVNFVVLHKALLNNLVLIRVFIPLLVFQRCILEQNHWVRRSELFKLLDTYDLTAFQKGLSSFASHKQIAGLPIFCADHLQFISCPENDQTVSFS